MRILGIDTSSMAAAAAIYDSELDIILAQQIAYTKRTHSQVILPLVERLFKDTGLLLNDIDKIAVAAGPGSYTGLRIGIAAVKAMAFALDKPCCGISTLKALSTGACPAGGGIVCAVMKARKGLVYAGIYQFDNGGIPSPLMSDALIQEKELLLKFSEYEKIILTGDGAECFINEYSPENTFLASAELRQQSCAALCRCAVYAGNQKPCELEAKYLQLVKAEKDRLDKNVK